MLTSDPSDAIGKVLGPGCKRSDLSPPHGILQSLSKSHYEKDGLKHPTSMDELLRTTTMDCKMGVNSCRNPYEPCSFWHDLKFYYTAILLKLNRFGLGLFLDERLLGDPMHAALKWYLNAINMLGKKPP